MRQIKLKIKKLRCSSGVSLTEMLVALIISALLALSVGAISRISITTSTKYKNEMEIYSDISYGFKLMQKYVRELDIPQNPLAPTGSWVSSRLYIDNNTGNDSVFGLYDDPATDTWDFVFIPDQSDETVREVLLSVSNPADDPTLLALTITRTGNAYAVQLEGEKNNIPFDVSTMILRR